MPILRSFSKHVLILISLCMLTILPLSAQDEASDGYAEALRLIEDPSFSDVTLDLSGLQLEALPPEIAQLTNLIALKLGGNRLTTLPSEIGQLTNLTLLDVSGNQLTSLPPELWQLTQLNSLFLQVNQLTSLPPEVGRLTKLVILDLSSNKLTSIPPEIGLLTQLFRLDLSNNQLTALPPEIGQLISVSSFSIRDNQITTLPLEVGQIDAAQTLLDGNPLTFPPTDIQAQGPAAVIFYLRDYNAMQLRQALIVIAVIGGVIALGVAFYWRQRHALLQAKKIL